MAATQSKMGKQSDHGHHLQGLQMIHVLQSTIISPSRNYSKRISWVGSLTFHSTHANREQEIVYVLKCVHVSLEDESCA